MLEQECDAILKTLEEHPDGYMLHQCTKEFFQQLRMNYEDLQLVIQILERDKYVHKSKGAHFINDAGVTLLENGGYTTFMRLRLDMNQQDDEKKRNTTSNNSTKLKWKGSVALFGFIMQELVGKGYIERPRGSYSKDAQVYLELFELDTTLATLTKEVNPSDSQNSFSPNNRNFFKIPVLSQLK